MNELIFITGYSGSGKTTISKNFKKMGYEIIHLDELTKYFTKERPITNPRILYFIDVVMKNTYVDNVSYTKDPLMVHNSFIKYIATLEGKYVIEGIQLITPNYIDLEFISDYQVYVMGTSFIRSTLNRINRGVHKNIPLNKKIINILRYDLALSHLLDINNLRKFKKQLKNKKLETI